ncbi:hypothetical protein JMJ35_004782 [Cladonia borealis]|uniref:Mesaconyl-C4 CoA hydratase n=1 Tax=Cladonia borealis TaxID=184061 RepID=A0AA39R2W2_9LECA|nr:hypothetical protein JMJ35_004782 [Cladonia borealis]
MHSTLVMRRAAASFVPTNPYLSLNGCIFKRHSSDLSELKAEMTARKLATISDVLTAIPTRLLNASLTDYLPNHFKAQPFTLPYGYHLVHFPPPIRSSKLLPDGTDPMQSPGGLFTRRMWAGGDIIFGPSGKLDNSYIHCVERISNVQVRGLEEDQKIFVSIERSVFPGKKAGDSRDETGRWTGGLLKEMRTLVFMRSDRPKAPVDPSNTSDKVLKTAQSPDYSHHLVPTPTLLFRFSALTFNAHAIHLDKQYCREVEGHRNLLVHGPLSLVLMLQFMQHCLMKENRERKDGKREWIRSIQYRNLAPLYAEEDMKICLKRKGQEDLKADWDVWIEGRDGGYAVKGAVTTKIVASNEVEVNHQVHNSG